MHCNPINGIVRLSELLPATLPVVKTTQQTGQQMLASAGQALGYVASAVEQQDLNSRAGEMAKKRS